jgi:hypothetical protein
LIYTHTSLSTEAAAIGLVKTAFVNKTDVKFIADFFDRTRSELGMILTLDLARTGYKEQLVVVADLNTIDIKCTHIIIYALTITLRR